MRMRGPLPAAGFVRSAKSSCELGKSHEVRGPFYGTRLGASDTIQWPRNTSIYSAEASCDLAEGAAGGFLTNVSEISAS